MPIVQQRRGTAASLQTVTLAAGQIAYETDTGKIKVGDGSTVYSGLEYVTDASNIADGAIATAKLADNSVTSAKIATDAVGSSEIAAGAVGNGEIANSAVIEAKIADDAVTYAKIQNVSATDKLLGRESASAGVVEEITCTAFARSVLDDADAATVRATIGAQVAGTYATTSDITTAINNVVDSAPGALDTLNELAAALGDDASFSTTVTNSIATKMPLAGGTFTGVVKIPSGNTPAAPKIAADGDTDTGIYFPGANEIAIGTGGNERLTVDDNYVNIARTAGQPSIKAKTGWMIVDSAASPCALNYFCTQDVILAYGNNSGGNVMVGTTSNANSRRLLVSGTVESTGTVYVPDGTNTDPAVRFASETNTGLYKPAANRIGLTVAGSVGLQVSSDGNVGISAVPSSAWKVYSAYVTSAVTNKQNIVAATQTESSGGSHYSIGINSSVTRKQTGTSQSDTGYIAASYQAASVETSNGSTHATIYGTWVAAQTHLASNGGTVTNCYGVHTEARNNSANTTIDSAYGVASKVRSLSTATGSTITSAHCYYGDISNDAGTITNGFGLLIGDINATNKYGVYVNDTDAINVYLGTSQFGATTGTAGSFVPGIAFRQDPDSGLGKNASSGNVVDLISGGSIVGEYRATGIATIDGTSSDCAYSFQADADTGMFRSTSTGLNLVWNGSGIQIATAYINNEKQLRIPDGTASDPAIAFASDPDTGLKLNSNGNMDLQHAGSNKISVTSAGSSLGGTVTFSGNVSDGVITKTASEVVNPPSSYGQNLLFG